MKRNKMNIQSSWKLLKKPARMDLPKKSLKIKISNLRLGVVQLKPEHTKKSCQGPKAVNITRLLSKAAHYTRVMILKIRFPEALLLRNSLKTNLMKFWKF